MGFSEEETAVIFRFVSAILHLGNADFIPLDGGEASRVAPGDESAARAASLLLIQVNASS